MLHRNLLTAMAVAVASLVVARCSLAVEVTVEKSKSGAVVKIDGQPFAEYLADYRGKAAGSTPIVWPIVGPTGKHMTLNFSEPEGPTKLLRDKHVHHRSLWFNHGDVNGLSFWDKADIKHLEFVKLQSGPKGVIVARDAWVDKDGKVQCTDQRQLTFGVDGEARYLDFDVTVKASNGPVTFGETKEGSFGVRVPATMAVDAKKSDPSVGGHIINSEGQENAEAWGKPARWVDYYGHVEGETLGIAILNHPASFRFPTTWHVRTYGLFAANPFGGRDFDKSASESGAYTIPDGQSISFHYRVLFHKGDEKEAKIAEAYARYAKEKKD